MRINNILLNNLKIKKIIKLLNQRKNIAINGLNNSRLSFFIGNIYNKIDRNILLLTYDNLQLEQHYEDLLRLVPNEKILIYPENEVLPHEQIVADLPEIRERLKVLQELTYNNSSSKIILTTGTALLRKLMPIKEFEKYSFSLNQEMVIDLNKLAKDLSMLGYKKVTMVEEPSCFSIRGGIVDVFTITNKKPYRIEFFGDEIDSIREFDPATQRSERKIEKVIIPPSKEYIFSSDKIEEVLNDIKRDYDEASKKLLFLGSKDEAEYLTEKKEEVLEKLQEYNQFPGDEQFLPYFFPKLDTLIDYFDDNVLVLFDQSEKIWSRIKKYDRELAETQTTLLEQGSIIPSYTDNYLSSENIFSIFARYNSIFFTSQYKRPPLPIYKEINFETKSVEPYFGQFNLLVDQLQKLIKKNYQIFITLNSASKAQRLANFLREEKLPAIFSKDEFKDSKVLVTTGSLSEGFIMEDFKLVFYSEKEIIGKKQRKKRQLREIDEGVKISSLNELNTGDYVVHENHGIGKYLGVKTMEIQGQHQDYLVLKYAGEDKLYVPTDQINLVQKYIGADNSPPKVYKLGGNDWKKIKQKVQNSVKEMAIGLLELYAERETMEGFSFSEETVWQKEFEEAFPYEETPDQLKAINDVKKDMEANTPMDRLLCGDVGYGKTEVAIRAAFKCVMDGKQTAVLVPTTILAQQHYNTFRDRMENYPIKIEMISRFKTLCEQREILKRLARGKVDIIIGTHRLLSKDIIFNDLGLLIVDEEQRFGVTHKEKLKDLKRNVDVLTLTATPIPRTLHMALVGVRDMSVIETPPENRYPIRTYIREFNKDLIRDAIRKEIARGGQIYFVHNRVEDIEKKSEMIQRLVPEARVAVGHGQMNEHRLEKLMLNFYDQNYDVLVCTTIIETGLDLPNVNTIIINKADQMGLAQLYQLRGRVGRSSRIAYAYLLYEKDRILPEIAEKRLRAVKEFTNLGSGFKIAMRDLEIRGAGNLLGPEQHGHIASIGFSLYCKLLEDAIKDLKGKKKDNKKIEIDIKMDAYIPENYIADSAQKIEIYKKIISVKNDDYYTDLVDELIDRFGEPPKPVINLINLSRIKNKAGRLGIVKISQENNIINCYFNNQCKLSGEMIFKLINKYPNRIKVRSGERIILGLKASLEKNHIKLLTSVIDNLLEMSGD